MQVAGFSDGEEFNLAGQGEAVRLVGSTVSANLFSVLGSRAELGRTLEAGDDRPGRDRIVVLSHALLRAASAQSAPCSAGRSWSRASRARSWA